MRPKPHPNYGCTVAEEENELPEATADALIGRKRRVDEMVMGEMDKAVKSAQGTERAGQGGTKGRCTKAGEGKAKMPSKRAYLSDTDNDQEPRARKKFGWNYGAVNWRELDLTVLLDLVEEILLAGNGRGYMVSFQSVLKTMTAPCDQLTPLRNSSKL